MNFTANLKSSTDTLHLASEKSGFIKRLLEGNATKEGYIEYLFNLYAMYDAIESSLDKHLNNENTKIYVTKELYRSELIKKDLDVLAGEKVANMKLLPSTEACIARIHEVDKENPELIIAYACVRFIADLFGGRIFPEVLTKFYNIPTNALNYYRQPDIGDTMAYVMKYYQNLDNINLSENMKDLFIIEANNAYIYNLAISNELDAKLYITK